MGSKEELMDELGFLDVAVVMDGKGEAAEREKGEGKPPKKESGEGEVGAKGFKSGDEVLLTLIGELSDSAAAGVISAYQRIPDEVKWAVEDTYEAVRGFEEGGEIGAVRDRLIELKTECGEEDKAVYETVLKAVKGEVAKIQSRQFVDSLNGEEAATGEQG